MRALLVVNPRATATSERSRDLLGRALHSALDLDMAYTRRRGHAMSLARHAAAAGCELVVVHGGDGTVNEVVNGLMAAGTGPHDRPVLGVVPGGSTNVFARALGLPREWAEAAGCMLEALRDHAGQGTVGQRTVGLGRVGDRYFTFCAGIGIDAAVVRRVEQARFRGRTSSPRLYLRAAAGQLLAAAGRREIAMTAPGVEEEALATVVVQNTAPWTFLWGRAVDLCPDASFDCGLDVLAVRSLRPPVAGRVAARLLAGREVPEGRHVARWHDLESVSLRAQSPQPIQVDGEYLGRTGEVTVTACPAALRVLCAPTVGAAPGSTPSRY